MQRTLSTFWNALALAAICFTGWTVYNVWSRTPEPVSVDQVEVGPTIIEAVKHVNKQTFIEHYTSIEVRDIDLPEGGWAWTQKLGLKQEFMMLIRGRVQAGIDLSQLDEDDIWVSSDGKRVQLTLPPPQIFAQDVTLDLANSHIIRSSDFCPGFICPDDRLASFQQEMEPEARQALIAAAREQGILSQAAADAEAYYEGLLNALGIAEVRVVIPGYTSQ